MSLRGRSQNELKHKVMIWESMWESQQNEKKEYVVDPQHDVRLPGLPVLKGKNQHECHKCKQVL